MFLLYSNMFLNFIKLCLHLQSMYGNLLIKVNSSYLVYMELHFLICTLKISKTIDFPMFSEKMTWNFGNPILQDRNCVFTLFFNGFGILLMEFWQLCIECIISYGVDTIVEHILLIGLFLCNQCYI